MKQYQPVLSADYSFVHGGNELGKMVRAVLNQRHQHRLRMADATVPDFYEAEQREWLAGFECAVEQCIYDLYGDDARLAFVQHCDDVERFLSSSMQIRA